MSIDFPVEISAEALNRLKVESAAGRGLRIERRSRLGGGWCDKTPGAWYWGQFEYRIAKPEPGKRTRAELMDQLTTLIAELKELDA